MIDPRFYDLAAYLYRGGSYAHYQTPDGENGERLSRWFATSDIPEPPTNWQDKNLYFCVNPSKMRRGEHEAISNADVAAVNCLYAEFDPKTPKEKAAILARIRKWLIQPACIIDSGGGLHVYVLLTQTQLLVTEAHRKAMADVQRAWVHYQAGDRAVVNLGRILRVPGTPNLKPEYAPNFPMVTILDFDLSIQHDLERIRQAVQPILDKWAAEEAHSPAQAQPSTLDDQTLLGVLWASKHGDLYRRLWAGDTAPGGNDHSRCDQMLCNGLAWLTGRDAARVDSLFRQSGLMRPKWADRDDYRERTIDAACKSAQTIYEPGKNGGHIDQEAVKAAQAVIGINGNGNGGGNGNNANNGSQSSSSGGGGQIPNGLTQTEQTIIDFLFAMAEWELLAGVCAKIAVKHGRAYLRNKFLILHNGDADLADEEIKQYRFAGMPISEQVEADLVRWGYSFLENELDGTIYTNGQPLDEAIRAEINLHGRDNGYGAKGQASLTALPETILVMARRNRKHPVRDWLKGLVWDGLPHLTEFISYFRDGHMPIVYSGGATTSVFGAFLRRWMLGAVARAFGDSSVQNPVLVLAGSQGIGKSYLPKWLCSDVPEFFVEGTIDPENPDHKRLLVTRFIWEISELPGTMNKTDANALKSFLTTGEATFRVPYAKDAITRPALASFFGTLNPTTGHLIDVTGNRRFLSVELQAIDKDYSLAINVSQLWAETMHYFQKGMNYKLSPEEEKAQNALNDASRMTNDTAEALLKYYDIDPTQTGWFEYTIDIAEILREKQHRTDVTKIATELRGMLGYGSTERRILGRRGKGFAGIQKK